MRDENDGEDMFDVRTSKRQHSFECSLLYIMTNGKRGVWDGSRRL